MKLIYEGYDDKLSEMLEWKKDDGFLFLEGPMLMSEAMNRNGRIYPKPLMEQAVDKYIKEFVSERRALGELNHPKDRPFADPAVAAIIVEKLEWQGNIVNGKVRVINSPMGQQIKALVEANFKMGMSSRGLGATRRVNEAQVLTKWVLNAIDAVDKPSGQVCYVDPVNEATLNEWTLEDGIWVEKKRFDESTFLNSLDRMLEVLKNSNR